MQKPAFSFYLSCDINVACRVRVSDLQGQLASFRAHYDDNSDAKPTAVFVVARITSCEETLGLETRTTYVDSSPSGCVWGEWLTFCVKVRIASYPPPPWLASCPNLLSPAETAERLCDPPPLPSDSTGTCPTTPCCPLAYSSIERGVH